MEHIVADETLESRLRGFVEPVEIRDAQGQVLGTYTPNVPPELRSIYEEAAKSFDLEEARRRLASCKPGEGRTTAQVLARLKALEQGE